MFFCFTADDVGYEGFSSEAHLTHLLDFLREQKVRGTFFPVPLAQKIPFGKKTGYVRILKETLTQGHEVAQHGIEHDRFEVGIPPRMVLDLPHEGPARERLQRERAAIEASLEVEPIRQRLAMGRKILEDALSIPMVGFRAPCLQICDNLFRALEAEGYRYDSSHYLQLAGWDLLNEKENPKLASISRQTFEQFQRYGKLRILPLTTEYTWYLTRKTFDRTLELARHDFCACLEAGIPFVPLAHVSPIQEGDHPDCGFELYRQLFAFARETCDARGEPLLFAPLAEACGASN